jgi:hypothetical protein
MLRMSRSAVYENPVAGAILFSCREVSCGHVPKISYEGELWNML